MLKTVTNFFFNQNLINYLVYRFIIVQALQTLLKRALLLSAQLINPTRDVVTVKQGTIIGQAERAETATICNMDAGQTVNIKF